MSEYIYDTSKVETRPEQGFTGETVVRCRDCKHYVIVDEIHGDYDDYPIYGCRLLKFSNARIDDDVQEPQDPDGFCAWGERKSK